MTDREHDASDVHRGDWTREDLCTLESSAGPMTLALERGTRGGRRLLIEHHRESGPPISMRIACRDLDVLAAVARMIVERGS